MGCCVSTNSKSSALGPQKYQHSLVGSQRPRSDAIESRAPPPSAEEETVKEVLSETPRPKTPSPLPVQHMPIFKPEELDYEAEEKRSHKPVFYKITQDEEEETEKKMPISNTVEEVSEMSEICSLSESVSTTTITRDDDEEVRQRVNRSPMKLPKNRSFSGDLGARRDRVVGKSPTRRSDQSPGRRNGNGVGSVRLVQNREPGQPMARRALRSEPRRREPGESSARRSRSPAITRTDGVATRSAVGRSPSARRSGKSPGRTAAVSTESSRRATEESSVEGNWPTTTNESLENPLVSLECFIFL
ncbi:hypothetical protein FNV43_RR07632 [Rhamnella rubrinervis]|uniref:Serine/arginine repetitive matrix protein 1-like n=1 Tax=Rhamnella rubrinervis TaxID=2594499 RepID=A0A8K0MMJ6_9ROSA|nr:hypothetical protein FNV43_RR07632 [Rhamnella rubrinervis]